MKRAPVSLPLIASPERAAVRRLDCRHQSACNSDADARRWDSWGCAGCRAHEPMTAHEKERDRHALLNLAAALFAVERHVALAPVAVRAAPTVKVRVRFASVLVCRCGNRKHPRARLCDPCRYAVAGRA